MHLPCQGSLLEASLNCHILACHRDGKQPRHHFSQSQEGWQALPPTVSWGQETEGLGLPHVL